MQEQNIEHQEYGEQRERFSAEFEKFIEAHVKKQISSTRIHISIFNTIVTLIIGSLGLISALAWDTYLRDLFDQLLKSESTLLTSFIYALTVTVVTVIVTVALGKFFRKKE